MSTCHWFKLNKALYSPEVDNVSVKNGRPPCKQLVLSAVDLDRSRAHQAEEGPKRERIRALVDPLALYHPGENLGAKPRRLLDTSPPRLTPSRGLRTPLKVKNTQFKIMFAIYPKKKRLQFLGKLICLTLKFNRGFEYTNFFRRIVKF